MNWLKILKRLKQLIDFFKICQLKILDYIKKKLTPRKLGTTATLERPTQLNTRMLMILLYVFLYVKWHLIDPLLKVYLTLIKRPIVWVYVNFLKPTAAWFYFFWKLIWRERYNIKYFLFQFFVFLVILLNIAVFFAPDVTLWFFGFL
jgi:hypothetical protein